MSTLRKRYYPKYFRECSTAYLRERLKLAIQDEQYETAAIIRDEIKDREDNGGRCVTVQTFKIQQEQDCD